MTTILHSIDTGGPGGAETVFATLAAAKGSYRNIALAKPGGWVEETLRDRGVEAHFANTRGSFNRAYLASIIRLIREHDVKLVQSHLFGSNLYCAVAGQLCGVPVVSAFHGAQDLSAPGLSTGIKRELVQRGSAALVAVSNTLRTELVAAGFHDDDKLHVIYNGIDVGRFSCGGANALRPTLGIPKNAPLIGAVGNVRRPKGYEVLVEAMARLMAYMPDLHLVIAGQGDGALLEALRHQISQAGLGTRIHLPGFVSDTPAFFSTLDAYVSSSHSEGFSLSCVEAMASGTPVVATRSGGPEEILEHERTGLLVPTGNPDALADAVLRTLSESAATQKRVEAAYTVVSLRFSVTAMVTAYHDLYDALLAPRGVH